MTSRQSRTDDEPLAVFDHSVVPTTIVDGAVREWRCVECGLSFDDVERYGDHPCPATPE